MIRQYNRIFALELFIGWTDFIMHALCFSECKDSKRGVRGKSLQDSMMD